MSDPVKNNALTPNTHRNCMKFGALALLEGLSDPVLVTDDQGVIVYANEAAAGLCGHKAHQLAGAAIWSVVDQWTLLWDEGERSDLLEGVIYRHDNLAVPVEISFSVWEEGGRRMIGAVIRSSAKRKAAEAEQADAQRAAKQAGRKAEAASERLRDALDMLPEAIVMLDKDDRYVLWNKKYEVLFREIAHLLKPGAYYPDVLRTSLDSGDHPDVWGDKEFWGDKESWYEQRMRDHRLPQGPTETRLRDGRWMRYDERRTADGGTIGIRIDISELKQREAGFRLLFDDNPVPMLILDSETLTFTAANDAALDHYKFSRERFLAMTVLDLHPPEQHAEVVHLLNTLGVAHDPSVTWTHLTADRRRISVIIYARALTYLGRPSIIAAVIDITERARIAEHIEHLANHDALTGLANRARFRTVLDRALMVRCLEEDRVALLYIDLDGFKPINDTHGHLVGDELLTMVGARFIRAVRSSDLVARIGGDEFAVILTKATGEPEAIAARVLEVLRAPFNVGDRSITVAASVGIALAPRDGFAADQLMAHADKALYAAKAAGRNTVKFYQQNFSRGRRKSA